MTDRLPPSADRVRDLFDRIAPVYDSLNGWLSLGQHKIWKQMAVKWSGAQPGDLCLDLCCGSGDLAQLLAARVCQPVRDVNGQRLRNDRGHVYGVDFSTEQLAVAAQRLQTKAEPLPITWIIGDALEIPFGNETFDAATMGYGLRNVGSIPKALQELHRVLKPGKKAAILDLHRPDSPMVRAFQQWYLDTVVVPVATNYGFREEYAYLSPSLDRFPTGDEQVNLAKQVGFSAATHYPIAGGTMGVLVLSKGSSSLP
jgi:demethylphylloquinol methyltransferase